MPRRATKSTAGNLRPWSRFIDTEVSAVEIGAVQGSNCPVRLSRVRHFDKGKAACAARVSVGYQLGATIVYLLCRRPAKKGLPPAVVRDQP